MISRLLQRHDKNSGDQQQQQRHTKSTEDEQEAKRQNATQLDERPDRGTDAQAAAAATDAAADSPLDDQCDRLLRVAKKQIKQILEEAVMKKCIHEQSSSMMSLCVAIDACLSHGLKRRTLGLFKTSSSMALIQKISKCCPSAQQVLESVEEEEKQQLEDEKQILQQQQLRRHSLAANQSNGDRPPHHQQSQQSSGIKSSVVNASNFNVYKRNLWIKCALMENKLVDIVEYLAVNAQKYYEPGALMANCLSAQIFCSLLVGSSALEFSRGRPLNDYYIYAYEEPSADELLRRHQLSNPIACLCSRSHLVNGGADKWHSNKVATDNNNKRNQLARAATDGHTEAEKLNMGAKNGDEQQLAVSGHREPMRQRGRILSSQGQELGRHICGVQAARAAAPPEIDAQDCGGVQQTSRMRSGKHELSPVDGKSDEVSGCDPQDRQLESENGPETNLDQIFSDDKCDRNNEEKASQQHVSAVNLYRRRPLALKTNFRSGALVTDCHHYSCQDITEHQHTRGYSFRSTNDSPRLLPSSNGHNNNNNNNLNLSPYDVTSTNKQPSPQQATFNHQANGTTTDAATVWPQIWSPRMLHETLHQNPKSNLLYAKNNVLLETQPNEAIAGYLSLHQTMSFDLILKWIPNQMINGGQCQKKGQSAYCCHSSRKNDQNNGITITARKRHRLDQRQCCESLMRQQIEQQASESNSSTPEPAARDDICSDRENSLSQDSDDQSSRTIGSQYLDLIVNLSVSRIVLLHCHFGETNFSEFRKNRAQSEPCADSPPPSTAKRPIDKTLSCRSPKSANERISAIEFIKEQVCDDPNNSDSNLHEPETQDNSNKDPTERESGRNHENGQVEDILVLFEADGVQRAPFIFPKGGLRWFLSCLEQGLRQQDKFLEVAIKPSRADMLAAGILKSQEEEHQQQLKNGSKNHWSNNNKDFFWVPDPLTSNCFIDDESKSVRSISSKNSSSLDSPSVSSEPVQSFSAIGSGLDTFFRRLPSLRHRHSIKSFNSETSSISSYSQVFEARNSTQSVGIENSGQECDQIGRMKERDGDAATAPIICMQENTHRPQMRVRHSITYVYRIISEQSMCPPNGPKSLDCLPNNCAEQQSNQSRFRWSLSRLRFSSSKSSATKSDTQNNETQRNSVAHISLKKHDFESLSSIETISTQCGNHSPHEPTRTNEFFRIEAKLNDLKKSSSDELVKLRNQSIQTLCDSMRRQLIARAFYGWLAHCKRIKIIRAHLTKLINSDKHLLSSEDERFRLSDKHGQLQSSYSQGLTQDIWNRLLNLASYTNDHDKIFIKINQLIYYGGIESDELRKQVWLYLLGHYEMSDDEKTRKKKDNEIKRTFKSCCVDWAPIERIVKQRDNEILAENMAKAAASKRKCETNKTPTNTEEDVEMVQDKSSLGTVSGSICSEDESGKEGEKENNCSLDKTVENTPATKKPEKTRSSGKSKARKPRRRVRLESTGSVGSDASITDQFGNNMHRIDKDVQRCDRNFWYFKDTKNLEKLRNVMCCYVWQHLDIGYVQGMCDLAAPFLVIFDDEILAFACFSQLMKRMVWNFPHGSAMDQHFESLKYLMQVLDPKLFEILQNNGDYTHFYFCYRWLLLDFKRELAYEDVFRVWETIWSARHIATDHFVIFMALAMVRYYRDIIIENNMDFTDTIKFFNEMAEKHDATRILVLARECVTELESLVFSNEQ